MEEKFISTTKAAKILGISRQAILKKIKSGELQAQKIGRNYVINSINLSQKEELTDQGRGILDSAVDKTVKDYSQTLELLGKE